MAAARVGHRTPGDGRHRSGSLLQTVDQQAYLQGFVTLMQLFLFNISGGLMKPTTRTLVPPSSSSRPLAPYLKTNRWEGTAPAETVGTPPVPIPY